MTRSFTTHRSPQQHFSDLSAHAVKRNLGLLTFEGSAYSLMVGLGETYLAAFAIAAGLGEYVAGLITTVPVLAGACLQLVSFWGVRRFRSNKYWAAFASLTQAAGMGIIAWLAYVDRVTTWSLLLVVSVYWFGGLAAGPAWNAWVTHIVPTDRITTYFGNRARICQASILAGLLLAGVILHQVPSPLAFLVLFSASAALRAVSAGAIALGTELPCWRPAQSHSCSFFSAIRELGPSNLRLLIFLFAMQAAVFIAAPFFTPYMLSHLGLGYGQFTWLIGLGFVGKIIAMPWVGRFATRLGSDRILFLGALGIAPISAVWVLTDSIALLSLVQIATGILWAFYELATQLLFFEKFRPSQRVAALSVFNFGNSAAMVVGSLAGGYLLTCWDGELLGYFVVFLTSSGLRLLSCCLIPAKDASTNSRATAREILFRIIAVRPTSGGWARPIFQRPGAQPELVKPATGQQPADNTLPNVAKPARALVST